MKKILPFFLLVLLLASCQKDPDMSKLSDDFVVFTDHNKDANFESFTTFYIPDSVMVIGSSEKPEFWSATEADDIVSTLVSGMEGRGYTRASDKESADLGLQVSFVKNVNYFTNYHDNPYWWWGIRDITGGMATGVTGLAHGMDGIIRILLYTAIA